MSDYEVGQQAMVCNINWGSGVVTVVKVGRTLVTVEDSNHIQEMYRMDTGAKNDAYGHSRIFTMQEWDDVEERADLTKRLQQAGVGLNTRIPAIKDLAWLRRVLAAAETTEETS